MSRTRLGRRIAHWLLVLVLLLGGIVMVFPLFWLVSTSLRPAPELLLVPPHLLPDHWTLDNYAAVFDAAPIPQWMWNSLAFATISTVFILLTSTVAGYVFAKFRFPATASCSCSCWPPRSSRSRSTWSRCSPR
jgi:multiple sugar transport system permease protein